MVTLSDFSTALISVFEGIQLKAYQDTGGVWTNGIGNTHGVVPGSTITMDQAAADFARNQAPLLAMVADLPVLKAAALVSFGFNCGQAALRRVLAGDDTIENPVHTTDRHGNVLPGLVARRRLESLLTKA